METDMEYVNLLLAQGAPAPAGTPPGAGAGAQWLGPLLMVGAIVAIFWFLVFRPERKKQKERQAMIESIGKNDKVVTIGGMHGIVKSINDHEVVLLVDEKTGAQIKLNRSAIFTKITGDESQGELEAPQR
jgi:preprotein translocase subunit YajC